MDTGKLLSVSEAAALLGVTAQTLRNWSNSGKIAAVRHPLNRYRFYKESDVLALREILPQRADKSLASVDWDFSNSENQSSIHSIHPYPAKFIPDIPRALIELFRPEKNTVVFDPFGGCGTTSVVAQELGYPSLSIDLNPIGCLATRVKTTPPPEGAIAVAESVVSSYKHQTSPRDYVSQIPRVAHWFDLDVADTIDVIRTEIRRTNVEYQDILSLALSAITVRVSRQESDTRYAAIPKDVRPNDVLAAFLDSTKKIFSACSSRYTRLDEPAEAEVHCGDILSVDSRSITSPIGLLVTSPPYPNAYEYWLYHKYRMYWLNHDPLRVKAAEIGARAHYFTKSPPTPDDFQRQMGCVMRLFAERAVPKAYACFVIGRSRIHGKTIDNTELLRTAARSADLQFVGSTDRTILASRKSFNLSHAGIKKETVMVFQK